MILDHYGSVYVSEHVQGESLWIREYDNESPPQLVPKMIDLQEFLHEGTVVVCRLEQEQEFELFVQLAQQLDDGEASVLAIAKNRGWIAATDDKKARRIAAEQGIPTITTSGIIHAWASSGTVDSQKVALILKNIHQFGRFIPHRSDPFHDWWMDLAEIKVK